MRSSRTRAKGHFSKSGLAVTVGALILGLVTMGNAPGQETSVRIASAQIFCLEGDRSGNFVRIENAFKAAKAEGAQLVAFPESCIFGWINPDAHTRACPIAGKDSDLLCELAKKYGVYLCIGIDEKEGDKLYGAALLIDDEGKMGPVEDQ